MADLLSNKTTLIILMVVLIVFVVLLTVLGIVFIIALRKRAPVVKVVMAPSMLKDEPEEESAPASAAQPAADQPAAAQPAAATVPMGEAAPQSAPPPPPPEPEDDEEDDDEPQYVTEGQERVSYNRSLTAKLAQLKNEVKDWYTELKNELLSYEKVKDRMSWKHESFRMGRVTVAKLVVRGKTLCLLLAVEPAGYEGTKFAVEDVSNVASTADTPTQYRIKSVRRLKYAKEMIAGMMKELKSFKDPRYAAQDFYIPYEGDLSLMHRGLIKRVVSGSTRTFKIEESSSSARDFKIEEVDEAKRSAQTEESAPVAENTPATENTEATESAPAKPARKSSKRTKKAEPESTEQEAAATGEVGETATETTGDETGDGENA